MNTDRKSSEKQVSAARLRALGTAQWSLRARPQPAPHKPFSVSIHGFLLSNKQLPTLD